jgi:hypothetical protein
LALHQNELRAVVGKLNPDLLQIVQGCLPVAVPQALAEAVDCSQHQRATPLVSAALSPTSTDTSTGTNVATSGTNPVGATDDASASALKTPSPAGKRNQPPPKKRSAVTGAMGAMYNPAWLKVIEPLYDMHMGVENMGTFKLQSSLFGMCHIKRRSNHRTATI